MGCTPPQGAELSEGIAAVKDDAAMPDVQQQEQQEEQQQQQPEMPGANAVADAVAGGGTDAVPLAEPSAAGAALLVTALPGLPVQAGGAPADAAEAIADESTALVPASAVAAQEPAECEAVQIALVAADVMGRGVTDADAAAGRGSADEPAGGLAVAPGTADASPAVPVAADDAGESEVAATAVAASNCGNSAERMECP